MPTRPRAPSRFPTLPHASLTVACLAALAGGCDSNASTTGSPSTDTSDLETMLASSFCSSEARCCAAAIGAAGGAAAPVPDAGAGAGGTGGTGPAIACGASAAGGTAATCDTRAMLGVEQQLALVSTAVTEGLLTIDDTVATTCATAYGNRACPASGEVTFPDVQSALADPTCAGLFTGYVPVGERCDMTAECVAGAYCLSQASGEAISSLEGGGTLGVCFSYGTAGSACNSNADCGPSLTCSPTTFVCAAP